MSQRDFTQDELRQAIAEQAEQVRKKKARLRAITEPLQAEIEHDRNWLRNLMLDYDKKTFKDENGSVTLTDPQERAKYKTATLEGLLARFPDIKAARREKVTISYDTATLEGMLEETPALRTARSTTKGKRVLKVS